ncbi:plasmid pRiA4b ORF-3 family protein [Streptomyces sp. NPDC097640]|uniref:plasmid pRiA4b ORF-3 family protein n=1 Tax=Streptomyces sp. NPDC097640 TaxID=3157229 RepID=UPI0033284F15
MSDETAADTPARIPRLERICIRGVYFPTARRVRDPANWYPSFKAAIDGLTDERCWDPTLSAPRTVIIAAARRQAGRVAAMANTRSTNPSSHIAPSRTVHKIKVTLRDSRPPVRRRLEVPSGTTLRASHGIIQAAFGWEDHHMSAFGIGHDRYGVSGPGLGIRSAASKRLDQVAPRTGDRLRNT